MVDDEFDVSIFRVRGLSSRDKDCDPGCAFRCISLSIHGDSRQVRLCVSLWMEWWQRLRM